MLQEFVDAKDRSGAALKQVDDPADRDHWPDELDHVDVEGTEIADCDAMLHHLVAAHEQGNHEAEAEHEFQRRPEHCHQANQVQGPPDVLLVGSFKRGNFRVFLGEGTDQAGAGEVFLGLGRNVRKHGLDAFESAVNALPEGLYQHRSEGQRADRAKRELGAQVDHERQGKDGEEEAVRAVHDCRAQQLTHGIQVVGCPGHNVTRAVGVIIAGGLAFEVGEHVVAQVELNLTGSANQHLAGDVEKDCGTRSYQHQAHAVVDDLGGGDAMLHIVQRMTDDGRNQDAENIVKNDRYASPGEVLPIAFQVRRERSDLIKHSWNLAWGDCRV